MLDTERMTSVSAAGALGAVRGTIAGQRAFTPTMPPASMPFATAADRQREFANLLGRASSTEVGKSVERQKSARQKEAAQDMVAIALVQPILKGLRDANRAAPPFGPGPAEKQFGGFVDAQWSRSLVRGGNFPLVKAVQRWMGERESPAVATAPAATNLARGVAK